jgi:hypothetical protein
MAVSTCALLVFLCVLGNAYSLEIESFESTFGHGYWMFGHGFHSTLGILCNEMGPQASYWPIDSNLDFLWVGEPVLVSGNYTFPSIEYNGTLTEVVDAGTVSGVQYYYIHYTQNVKFDGILTCIDVPSEDIAEGVSFGLFCNARIGIRAITAVLPAEFSYTPVCDETTPLRSIAVGHFFFVESTGVVDSSSSMLMPSFIATVFLYLIAFF